MSGDAIVVIICLSFWFLFPLGMFLSIAKLDKDTYQNINLNQAHKEVEQIEDGEELKS